MGKNKNILEIEFVFLSEFHKPRTYDLCSVEMKSVQIIIQIMNCFSFFFFTPKRRENADIRKRKYKCFITIMTSNAMVLIRLMCTSVKLHIYMGAMQSWYFWCLPLISLIRTVSFSSEQTDHLSTQFTSFVQLRQF